MALRDTACEIMDPDYEEDGGEVLAGLFSASAAPLFSAIEDQVIGLARRDSLASLEEPGFIERAVRLLFGLGRAGRGLADTRLEALRRAIVVARHRRHLPDAMAGELRAQGFGEAQLRAIEARALAG